MWSKIVVWLDEPKYPGFGYGVGLGLTGDDGPRERSLVCSALASKNNCIIAFTGRLELLGMVCRALLFF